MKTHVAMIGLLWASLIAASPALSAGLMMQPVVNEESPRILLAAADCNAIGQREAARDGGQLRRAVAVQRGGQTVCEITYTVPGTGGKPPRRVERRVPAG